mgnify:CR=1 FL=1
MTDRIKQLRRALGGLTQAELAARIRIDQSTVSRLENGAPLDGPILTAIEALEALASGAAQPTEVA